MNRIPRRNSFARAARFLNPVITATLAAVTVFIALAAASQAQTLNTLATFDYTVNGSGPVYGPLAQGTDGNFYGTASSGGVKGKGTVFRMTPTGTLTALYTFCSQANCSDGTVPYAGLVLGTDGNFYGSSITGGADCQGCRGYGTVFKITASGVLTTLHHFSLRDGAYPYAPLVQGTDGNFYGTTEAGGTNSGGTVFRITAAGNLTTLHNFDLIDGIQPQAAALLQGSDGKFYGTAYNGGTNGLGTIFNVTTSGDVTTLYNFCSETNCADGASPESGLVLGNDGNFYGTTEFGGTNAYGTVFQFTPGGKLTTLHTFDSIDGGYLHAGLVQAADGTFYGTTPSLGANTFGTAFAITSAGAFTTLYNFCAQSGCSDGSSPLAQLLLGANGDLYGETQGGGNDNSGTIFRLEVGLGPAVSTLPTSGNVGSSVRILGTNLSGATAVSFNGAPASFTVISRTLIRTTVPTGATTGRVQVTTPSGTLTSNAVFPVIQ
jgi:uncharacterized repeat protein (TIGR03803 family)